LREDAPDLVAFTVIVRGARGFAFLLAILVLAFIVVFGSNARHLCQLP